MRWLEDQVRLIQERHDNLIRENTYMRHMHSAQSQKLDQLLKRESEYQTQEAATVSLPVKRAPHLVRQRLRPGLAFDHPSSQNSALDLAQSSKTEGEEGTRHCLPALSNPTAIYGFLPHQVFIRRHTKSIAITNGTTRSEQVTNLFF